jgi:hypothetical protein
MSVQMDQTDRAIAQAVRRWLFAMTSCEILSGRIDTGAGLSPSFFGFSLLIFTPLLFHTHLRSSTTALRAMRYP